MFYTKTLKLAILFLFSLGLGWAQTQSEAEKKLEQTLAAAQKAKKEKKQKKTKVRSALELTCESYTDEHDKSVCFSAQSREMAEKATRAREAALASEPASMKAERERLVKEEKRQARAEHEMSEASARVSGCPTGTVQVDPGVVRSRTWGFVNARYSVFNTSNVPIDIRDDRVGVDVVRNLCPGGRITIVKVFPMLADGDQFQVSYTATGVVSGRVAISHSPQTSLSIYMAQSQATQLVQWDVRLQIY